MLVSAHGEVAQDIADNSPLIRKMKKKKFLQGIILHVNKINELRVFIREEIGRMQNVAWLSEKDIEEWNDSEVQAYLHFTKKRHKNESAKEAVFSN